MVPVLWTGRPLDFSRGDPATLMCGGCAGDCEWMIRTRCNYDFSAPRISRRRAYYIEPVHPAGIAVCVRPIGTKIPDERITSVDRNGSHVRRHCHLGRGGGRLGGSRQPIRPPTFDGAIGGLRSYPAVTTAGGLDGPSIGCAGKSIDTDGCWGRWKNRIGPLSVA